MPFETRCRPTRRALILILHERLVHDRLELRHLAATVGKHQLWRLLIEYFEEDRLDAVSGERFLVRQKPIEDDASAENVGAAVDLLPADLLRRHIIRRSEHGARLRLRGLRKPRDAEIHDLRDAALGDEDVRGFDISVNDMVLVSVRETTAGLRDHVQFFFER